VFNGHLLRHRRVCELVDPAWHRGISVDQRLPPIRSREWSGRVARNCAKAIALTVRHSTRWSSFASASLVRTGLRRWS
jgi:hypothetical protein